MKKIIATLVLFLYSTTTFATGFPSFPMTIWGTLKNGTTNVTTGATIKFYDGSNAEIAQYTTTQNGQFGGNLPTDLSPTLQQYSGNLTMKVTTGGMTYTLDQMNLSDTLKGANCPAKTAITFVSEVCRYDINLVKTVDTFSGAVTTTGSLSVSGATTSGFTFSSSGTLNLNGTTGSGRVAIPTGGLQITSSGSWDGYLMAPEVVTTTGSLTLTGYTRIPTTYQAGSNTVSLTLVGNLATLTLYVGTSYNGKTLKVYRSENNQATYIYLTDCLVANGECTFQTNKFSHFATLSPVTLATVSTAAAASVTASTATLGGNASSANGGNITARGVVYGTTIDPIIGGAGVTNLASGNGIGVYTVNANGLNANAAYYARAYATNEAGTSYGSSVTFITLSSGSGGGGGGGGSSYDTCPSGDFSATSTDGMCYGLAKLSTSNASSVTNTSANISGIITSSGLLTVTERGVILSTSTGVTVGTSGVQKILSGTGIGTFTVIYKDLKANTKYYARAYAVNTSGTAYGNEITFTTSLTGTITQTNTGTTQTGTTTAIINKPTPPIPPKTATANLPSTIKDLKFKDIKNHWSYAYVARLAFKGIINNADNFNPDNFSTRAEFLKMIVLASGADVTTISTSVPFEDVNTSSWFAPYVAYGLKQGWISSNNRNFRPNDTIKREEAIKILALVLKLEVKNKTTTFSDVEMNSIFIPYIEAAKNANIISGQSENGTLKFNPKNNITRAEIAKILAKAFK